MNKTPAEEREEKKKLISKWWKEVVMQINTTYGYRLAVGTRAVITQNDNEKKR